MSKRYFKVCNICGSEVEEKSEYVTPENWIDGYMNNFNLYFGTGMTFEIETDSGDFCSKDCFGFFIGSVFDYAKNNIINQVYQIT